MLTLKVSSHLAELQQTRLLEALSHFIIRPTEKEVMSAYGFS